MIDIAESFFPISIIFMVVMVLIIVRGMAGAGRRSRRRQGPDMSEVHDAYLGMEAGTGGWRCVIPNCRASNPAHARYCRMCGAKRAYR